MIGESRAGHDAPSLAGGLRRHPSLPALPRPRPRQESGKVPDQGRVLFQLGRPLAAGNGARRVVEPASGLQGRQHGPRRGRLRGNRLPHRIPRARPSAPLRPDRGCVGEDLGSKLRGCAVRQRKGANSPDQGHRPLPRPPAHARADGRHDAAGLRTGPPRSPVPRGPGRHRHLRGHGVRDAPNRLLVSENFTTPLFLLTSSPCAGTSTAPVRSDGSRLCPSPRWRR